MNSLPKVTDEDFANVMKLYTECSKALGITRDDIFGDGEKKNCWKCGKELRDKWIFTIHENGVRFPDCIKDVCGDCFSKYCKENGVEALPANKDAVIKEEYEE